MGNVGSRRRKTWLPDKDGRNESLGVDGREMSKPLFRELDQAVQKYYVQCRNGGKE